jgi:hypothetical protein
VEPLPSSFSHDGVLPQDYAVTFDEIRHSLLVDGPLDKAPNWDTAWRSLLLGNLEILVRQLWSVGVGAIHVDGSFVENIAHPGDIDGCFECSFDDWNSGSLERRLNAIAPKPVWDWTEEGKKVVLGQRRLPMWWSYRVELFPYSLSIPSGIVTEDGLIPFPDAFRLRKQVAGKKGILQLRQDVFKEAHYAD